MATRGIRKPEKALAARFVDTVSKQGKYFDGHGLYLRVQPNGSKQWVQRITIRGKRCELGLGSPPAISLATARKLALENRGKAMLGGDPLQERRDARAVKYGAGPAHSAVARRARQMATGRDRRSMPSTQSMYLRPAASAQATASRSGRLRALASWIRSGTFAP